MDVDLVKGQTNFALMRFDFFIQNIPTSNPFFKAFHVYIVNTIAYFTDGIVNGIVCGFTTGFQTYFT